MKQILELDGVKYPGYYYDPETQELIGHRGKPLKKHFGDIAYLISCGKKKKYVAISKLIEVYGEATPKKEKVVFDTVVNLDDISETLHKIQETKSDREIFLEERGLDNSIIWHSDILVLSKAQSLLDTSSINEYDIIESRAQYMMEKHNLPQTSLTEVMTQIAASIVIAKEDASKIKYLRQYNDLDIKEVLNVACPYSNKDLESFLLDEWTKQLRERFYTKIRYIHRGVALRDYMDVHLPLNTLAQVQSAFRLLTDLFGWES